VSIRTILEVIGAALAGIAIWVASVQHEAAPAAPAQKNPTLASVDTVDAHPKRVIVYAPEAKAKLRLPAATVENESIAVLDSSKLPESDRPQTVTTVLNIESGESSTMFSVDPYPLFKFESRKQVGFSYGMTNGGKWLGLATISDDLVQIKALHFGVNGYVDTNGQVFAGVGVSYSW